MRVVGVARQGSGRRISSRAHDRAAVHVDRRRRSCRWDAYGMVNGHALFVAWRRRAGRGLIQARCGQGKVRRRPPPPTSPGEDLHSNKRRCWTMRWEPCNVDRPPRSWAAGFPRSRTLSCPALPRCPSRVLTDTSKWRSSVRHARAGGCDLRPPLLHPPSAWPATRFRDGMTLAGRALIRCISRRAARFQGVAYDGKWECPVQICSLDFLRSNF